MRNRIGTVVKPGWGDGRGGFGVIVRVAFDDGISWAAKVTSRSQYTAITNGINAVKALQVYCPHIPVVETHGGIEVVESNSDYIFHFMDWVEGVHPVETSTKDEAGWLNVTLPETLIPQLAQFVYNLTTCPLPASEGERRSESECNSSREAYQGNN
jgi:hypothetical protein